METDSGRMTAARTAVAAFGGAESAQARSLALCSLVVALARDTDHAYAASTACEALALAQRSADGCSARIALRALVASARAGGRNETALTFVRELRAAGDASALAEEIELLELLDDAAAARELLDRQRDAAAAHDARIGVAELRHDYAFGSLAAAAATARSMLSRAATSDRSRGALEARVVLGRVAQLRGEYGLAHRHLLAAEALAYHDDGWPALLMLTRAALARDEGEVARSHDIFREVVHRMRDAARLDWLPEWFVEGTRSALDLGDAETAGRMAELARTLHAGTPSSASYAAIAAQTAGLLAGDASLLSEAVRLARTSPRARVRAEAALDYGRKLIEQGRENEGIAQLDDAWDSFDRLGARGRAVVVQRLLSGAGIRRRKWTPSAARPLAGWDALSDTERRVARLIGHGHTNRSAAAELGSATDTVCSHVRSIFGKLGISSRVQLARMVDCEA